MNEFTVVELPFNAEDLETLGTKAKFWFYSSDNKPTRDLFKFSWKTTGEHWSEKIAEQLCMLLKIPHAEYELGRSNGKLGVISKNLIPKNSRMVMGNEVLHAHSPGVYPKPNNETIVRVKEHTVNRILGTLDKSSILPPITEYDLGTLNAGDVFCGYLMLDTLISNQDRHHENWAIIVNNETAVKTLCPTYDHAASLGRELLDADRLLRLKTKDKNRQVSSFVKKARSEVFKFKNDKKPLTTIDAFYHAVRNRVNAKDYWLGQLEALSDGNIEHIFDRIPIDVMSQPAKDFAFKMIQENKKRLLNYE